MSTKNKNQEQADLDIDPDTLERDDTIIGVALRWSLVVFAILGIIVGTAVYVFWPKPPVAAAKQTQLAPVALRTKSDVQIPHVTFTDITRQAGINFRHENGAIGKKLLPETMGG